MRLGIVAVAAVLGLAIGPPVARAADETTQFRVDAQHSNGVPDSSLRPPLRLRWQANLGEVVSNVVVAGGRVFYVRQPGPRMQITALRASDGMLLWSRTWMEDTWGLNGLAFDGGRLFWVRNHSGDWPPDVHVEAIDPVSGATIWNRNLPGEYGAGSYPTVGAGELYLLADGLGPATLYSLRQSDGGDRWAPKALSDGSDSTPSLDGSNVYVSLSGPQTDAFARSTGAHRWHYGPCCNSGSGTTTMLFAGRLFGDSGVIHDTTTGAVVGSWTSQGAPTWSGSSGVALARHKLRGFGPTYESTRWEFAINDSTDFTLPLVAGPYAYVATTGVSPGQLMALQLSDGVPVWCQTLPPPPPGATSSSAPRPVAAGHGLLLVGNGPGLMAYESGGPSTGCPTSTPTTGEPTLLGGTGTPGGTGKPMLRLAVDRRRLVVGNPTTVVGRLSGVTNPGSGRIALEVDPWPFDGRFQRAADATMSSDGSVRFRYVPRRNAQLRARLVGDVVTVSPAVTLYADFRVTVRKRNAGSRSPLLAVTIHAPRRAQVRHRPVYGYLTRAGEPWRRVARARWHGGRRSASATLHYPRGRLRGGDRWLVCTREATPDAFGGPRKIDRLCGRRTLPR